jgi:flagellin
MARINTNIPAITAQTHLARANQELNTTLTRLSTGLRINRGADDPAGLIVSENLRSEMASIQQAIDNSQRASNVIATAEGALSEVGNLLINIKELAVEAANSGALSKEEIRANQLQVDSAIASITRIANSTTFAGLHLLNGNLGYVTSGVATSAVRALDIYSAQLADQNFMAVRVSGVTSAQKGILDYRTSTVSATVTLEIASNRGVETLSFVSGTSVSAILNAVNAVTAVTGVSAAFLSAGAHNHGIRLQSVDYGSDAFVSVNRLPSSRGSFDITNMAGSHVQRDEGGDISVTINGAMAVGSGTEITFNTTGLALRMSLANAFAAGDTTTFAITGGGSMFQLGPHVNTSEQVNIGIGSIAASRLGSIATGFLNEVATGGAYSLVNGSSADSIAIVEKAIDQISVLRGRLGAFEKNTLDTNKNSLQISLENITASESAIRDADFAVETSNLTRNQILVNAGTSVLALANQTPQSVLKLLQ